MIFNEYEFKRNFIVLVHVYRRSIPLQLLQKQRNNTCIFSFLDYEMSARESQNGKALISASTQTQNNNHKADAVSSKDTISNENSENATKLANNSNVGNGPLHQNDVSL